MRTSASGDETQDSTLSLMLYFSRASTHAKGLEVQLFSKPNKQYQTYMLIQKIWEKAKQLQRVINTSYSSFWNNHTYTGLAKLRHAAKWWVFRVTHLKHIFDNAHLLSNGRRPWRLYGYALLILTLYFIKSSSYPTCVPWVSAQTPLCARCNRDTGHLKYLIWRCLKLCCYWNTVVNVVNTPFQV